MSHLGIDYGSKLAGTTAIAYIKKDKIKVVQSVKNKDADAFILSVIEDTNPDKVFIDAPLSLPAAFYNKGDNYFYRDCDIKLKAMSPMFLGGLTARAMRLKSIITKKQTLVYETYPKALVNINTDLKPMYDKKSKDHIIPFCKLLKQEIPYSWTSLTNWHQVDAVLAWWSGYRHLNKEAIVIGNKQEGQIIY